MATPVDRGEVLYQLERLAREAQLTDECEEETIRRCIKAIEQLVPTLTPPNEWVSVEDRLPDDEARQYIEDELDGMGYWYPCMLTYKSHNSTRIQLCSYHQEIIHRWSAK